MPLTMAEERMCGRIITLKAVKRQGNQFRLLILDSISTSQVADSI